MFVRSSTRSRRLNASRELSGILHRCLSDPVGFVTTNELSAEKQNHYAINSAPLIP